MNNTYKTNKTNWRRLVRSVLFVALLLGGNVVAQTDYVFMYNNYIFGQTTSVSTDFIPNNCVYTGTSGSTFRNGNGYYIVYANQSVNFSTSSGSNLTINNNYLYYNNTYYLRYSGSANNNQGGWQFRNNYNVQATVYTVTTSSHIESFSISGDATISATGTNSSYTHTNANYYDIYSFNSLTYYSTDPSAAASTTAPTSGLPTLTTGYTWSLSSNSYATVNATTGAITVNSLPASDQNVTLTCSVTRNGVTQTANKTITIEGPKVDPTGISITSGDAITAYVGNTSNITYNLTPSPCYNNVTFSSANTGIASVNGSGVVTGVATGTTTITVTALKINGTTTSALTKTVSVTVKDKVATPVIAFTPTVADAGATATAEITCSTPGTAIYYTVNGNDPTSSSTLYNNTFTLNDGDIVKAIAIKTTDATYWDNSDIASRTYTACSTTAPVITYTQSGSSANVTITAETGATIYYTTDGSDPSTSNYTGNGTTTVTFNGVATGTTVKAVAKNGTCQASAIVSKEIITSGVSGGVVTLYDYEDHSWAYYSDENCPVHRLNPADVKITYRGYGDNTMTSTNTDVKPANAQFNQNVASSAVQVNKNEAGHTFIYYKTLENANEAGTGNYPYTMIPNPFQVRPTYNNDWRGFYAWRVNSLSAGLSIKVGNTTYTSSNISSGIIIYAEQEVEFITSNATGNEVVFEALWAKAYLNSNTYYSNDGDYRNAYERNFKTVTSLTTYDYPVTISSINPDGSGTVGSVTRTSNYTCTQDVKLENMTLNMSSYYFNGDSYNLTIGRGVANGNNNLATSVYGDYSPNSVRTPFTLRIESGKYSSDLYVFYAGGYTKYNNTACIATFILGSDYDRAKNDNSKLTISGEVDMGGNGYYCSNANSRINTYILSGTIGAGADDKEVYMGFVNSGSACNTVRKLEIFGGLLQNGIAGGIEGGSVSTTNPNMTMRIRGGTINRRFYGAGTYSPAYGDKRIVVTGGTITTWISGGAYGKNNTEGNTQGDIYLYFGGRASQTNTDGIFGAGYGNYTTGDDKYTVYKSNVVFADEATTAGSVYGGGNNGYAKQDIQVYVAGGHVAGNVFGGANKARSEGAVAVTVTGGSVNGGVYGGSNQSGAISGQITVDVYGTDPAPSANAYAINQVFGGGNVAAYTGTPVVTVHNDSSCNISIGEIYGGGNQATVTGTNVTIEAGNIIGDVYGGGRQANVGNNGTSVTVNGGIIRRVFGGNNISGTIANGTAGKIAVSVDKTSSCPMKIGQVFGGGNRAASQVGSITVGCTGDLVTPLADGQRYGYDQEGIGAVYGGANNAAITGDITLNIVSGIVDSVFGGNNAGGNITGDITVNIAKNAKTCSWYVGYVFGGGNNAAYSQVSDGHPEVNVSAGLVTHHVFGGGNGSGATVTGNPTVTLSGTAQVGGNVFGGGNAAAVDGNTSVKLQN